MATTLCGLTRIADAALIVSSSADAGPGTLRNALLNLAQKGDTIMFDPALNGTTIVLNTGELSVSLDELAIVGPGADQLTIVGLNQRVFHFIPAKDMNQIPVPTHFHIGGLRLRGSVLGASGQGVQGGAILNESLCTLTVTNCYFEGCRAQGGAGQNAPDNGSLGGAGGSACAGAIYDDGDLLLERCAFINNQAVGGDGGNGGGGSPFGSAGGNGGIAQGGAICIAYNAGGLEIANCTFFGNGVFGGKGGDGGPGFSSISHPGAAIGGNGGKGGDTQGGGIFITRGCDHDCIGVVHSTVTQNVCSPGKGGQGGAGANGGPAGTPGTTGAASGCGLCSISQLPFLPPVGSSIFAVNYATSGTTPSGPDVWGIMDSQKYNLLGIMDGGSSGWIPGFEIFGWTTLPLDPLLGPPQNNGGQTPTLAPLANSPAIDSGISQNFLHDQAGQLRPVLLSALVNGSDGSDIGAFELQSYSTNSPFKLTITPTPTNTGVISWPAFSTRFSLQESGDLLGTGWQVSTGLVNLIGSENQVLIPMTLTQRFFKLAQP
jgi:hypothetical protein